MSFGRQPGSESVSKQVFLGRKVDVDFGIQIPGEPLPVSCMPAYVHTWSVCIHVQFKSCVPLIPLCKIDLMPTVPNFREGHEGSGNLYKAWMLVRGKYHMN